MRSRWSNYVIRKFSISKEYLNRWKTDAHSTRVNTLLDLLIIHQSTLQKPQFSQDTFSQLLITLSIFLIHPFLTCHPITTNHIFDVLALLTDFIPEETRTRCIRILRDQYRSHDPRLLFLFGYPSSVESEWLQLVTDSAPPSTSKQTMENVDAATRQPFPLRKWEIMQDATPLMGENDTSLSLALFGARKVVGWIYRNIYDLVIVMNDPSKRHWCGFCDTPVFLY